MQINHVCTDQIDHRCKHERNRKSRNIHFADDFLQWITFFIFYRIFDLVGPGKFCTVPHIHSAAFARFQFISLTAVDCTKFFRACLFTTFRTEINLNTRCFFGRIVEFHIRPQSGSSQSAGMCTDNRCIVIGKHHIRTNTAVVQCTGRIQGNPLIPVESPAQIQTPFGTRLHFLQGNGFDGNPGFKNPTAPFDRRYRFYITLPGVVTFITLGFENSIPNRTQCIDGKIIRRKVHIIDLFACPRGKHQFHTVIADDPQRVIQQCPCNHTVGTALTAVHGHINVLIIPRKIKLGLLCR